MTTNSPFEQAKAQYVHRYTMEHKPVWANKPKSDGRYYAPQYLTDKEWYDNNYLHLNPLHDKGHCRTQNTTWPLGKTLASSFRVGKPPEGFEIYLVKIDFGEYFLWERDDASEASEHFASYTEALADAYQQPVIVMDKYITEQEMKLLIEIRYKITEKDKAQQHEANMIAAYIAVGLRDNNYESTHSKWTKGCLELVSDALAYVPYLQALKASQKLGNGIFAYEVVEFFGCWFGDAARTSGDAPSSEACHTKIFELADDFFDDTEALIAANQAYLDK